MINNEDNYIKYSCDGAVETFAVSVEYLEDTGNLGIFYIETSTGDQYRLTEGVNFTIHPKTHVLTTISGDIPGIGRVTTPYASGIDILIVLDVPYTQTTDIVSNSNYDPEVLEAAWDKCTLLSQQLKETSDRTLHLPMSDAGKDLELPPLETLKGGILGFDENGEVQVHQGYIPELYSGTKEYQPGIVVQHGGFFYRCLQESTGDTPTGEPGVDLYWTMLAVDGLNYNPGFYYLLNDFCEYGGYLFKSAIASNRGNTPTTPDGDANWTRVFEKGDPGEDGADGAPSNAWVAGTYLQNVFVTHNGEFWRCIAESTTEEPSVSCNDWLGYAPEPRLSALLLQQIHSAWAMVSGCTSSIGSTNGCLDLAYAEDLNMMVGVTNTPGNNAVRADSSSYYNMALDDHTWVEIAASPSRFVVVGEDSPTNIAVSIDGINWSYYNNPGGALNRIIYDRHTSRFICGGASTWFSGYSTDGVSWTEGVSPRAIVDLATNNNGLIVGVTGGNSYIVYSTDGGATWSEHPVSGQFYGIAYSEPLRMWLAVNNVTSKIYRSRDGLSWTEANNPAGASYDKVRALRFHAAFILCGRGLSSRYVSMTVDGDKIVTGNNKWSHATGAAEWANSGDIVVCRNTTSQTFLDSERKA